MSVEEAEDLFRRTVEFWQRWIAQSRYAGRWREMVHRSAADRSTLFTGFLLLWRSPTSHARASSRLLGVVAAAF
jgi:hypothetical protein